MFGKKVELVYGKNCSADDDCYDIIKKVIINDNIEITNEDDIYTIDSLSYYVRDNGIIPLDYLHFFVKFFELESYFLVSEIEDDSWECDDCGTIFDESCSITFIPTGEEIDFYTDGHFGNSKLPSVYLFEYAIQNSTFVYENCEE